MQARESGGNQQIMPQNFRVSGFNCGLRGANLRAKIRFDFGWIGFFGTQARAPKLQCAFDFAFGAARERINGARGVVPRRAQLVVVAGEFFSHIAALRQVAAQFQRLAFALQILELAARNRFVDLFLRLAAPLRFARHFHAQKDVIRRAQVAGEIPRFAPHSLVRVAVLWHSNRNRFTRSPLMNLEPKEPFSVRADEAAHTQFDTIIIGGGQGGALAKLLGEGGQRVALIEKEAIGGTCANRGCTPTKAHIACAKRAQDAREADQLGIQISEVQVDMPAVQKRTALIVKEFRESSENNLKQIESVVVLGATARFTGKHTVEARFPDGKIVELTAPNIVIATGAHTVPPPIDGLDEIDWVDHRGMLALQQVPGHLVIFGGGYIACEFSQMFRRLGARVTLVQSGPHLLDREDDDVADAMADLLRYAGVELICDDKARSVKTVGDEIEATLESGSKIKATTLMLAAGQKPCTEVLELENTDVELTESKHIKVDDTLQAAPGIWGLGDVKGGPAFTHIAYDDARILRDILLHDKKRSIKDRQVPYVVFTDPQLGRIGLSESEAKEKGLKYRVAKIKISETARGIENGQSRGFLKALVGEDDQILGGAFLCYEGGEILAALQIAMLGKLPYTALRDGVFAHPTQVESLNNMFMKLDD